MMVSLLKRATKFISSVMIKNIPLFITASMFKYMGFLEARRILLDTGIPLIMAYTAGNKIEKKHGGTVAIIASIGVLTEFHFVSLLEPIILGIISGYILKGFYEVATRYQKPGYEMLINNIGVTGVGLSLVYILHAMFGSFFKVPSDILENLIGKMLQNESVLFFTIIIEPLKVFFLNNLVNHGIFSVLGMAEIFEKGKSIYFLLETNPGPGFGILLAYYYCTKKKEMLSNSFIILFGGVHEIYFIYILRKLSLLIPLVVGSVTGTYLNYLFNTGLTGIASPGSIFMIELLAPPRDRLLILFTTAISGLVTFFLAYIFIKKNINLKDVNKVKIEEKEKKEALIFDGVPKNILVVCDAGMGSSAMGASFLKQKLEKKGLEEIRVNNSSVENIPKNKADIIVIHREIYKRLKKNIKEVEVIIIEDFLNGKTYDNLVERIIQKKKELEIKKSEKSERNENWLKKSNIKMGLKRVDKFQAIENMGKDLYENGYVNKAYIENMMCREEISSTYLESGIAMPRGSVMSKKNILKSGIIIHQYPYGIDYGNNKIAYILIGMAVKKEDHIDFLTKLSEVIDQDEKTNKLCMALDEDEIYEVFDWRD